MTPKVWEISPYIGPSLRGENGLLFRQLSGNVDPTLDGVMLRHRSCFVPEKLLNLRGIRSIGGEVCRCGVPERMEVKITYFGPVSNAQAFEIFTQARGIWNFVINYFACGVVILWA